MNYTKPEVYEFISKKTSDPIVEWKTCEISGQKFAIFQSDLDFYSKVSPKFCDQVIQIPTPKLCPEERLRRRLSFRNDRKLYRRKCDATGESVVSIYSEDKNYKVYGGKEWWGDSWDALNYSLDVDFSKSFNELFYKLFSIVPQISIMNDDGFGSENCAYCQDFALGKNCYFVFESGEIEDSMYSHHCNTAKSVVDCDQVISSSSFCYECVASSNLYDCKYLQNCVDCSSCMFGYNLNGCTNCFACVNLTNKQYYIFNKEFTKEGYKLEIQKILGPGNNLEEVKTKFYAFMKENVKLFSFIRNSESSFGDFIYNCKNVLGFGSFNCEDSKYILNGDRLKNCYDFQAWKAEYCLEGLTSDNSYKTCFTTRCWKCENVYYSHNCHSCKNVFLCIGLKHKEYCILNKQYTKEEYEQLVPKIIEHMQKTEEWGEFFKPSFSPFGYNETVAQEYFPLTNEEALTRGYKWQDHNYDPKISEGIIPIKKSDYSDEEWERLKKSEDILKKIFICEVSGRPFRIIKQELEFYKKHNLLLPKKHSDIRHEERLKKRSNMELYLRNCDDCGKEMLSVYTSTGSVGQLKVYCEECYQKKVY